jgi:thiol:disulfide interchange protein
MWPLAFSLFRLVSRQGTMASPSNYHVVTSPEHLQDLLGRDLNVVGVLNFRADWAEPCKQMDVVAKELASKYSRALFLEVGESPFDFEGIIVIMDSVLPD